MTRQLLKLAVTTSGYKKTALSHQETIRLVLTQSLFHHQTLRVSCTWVTLGTRRCKIWLSVKSVCKDLTRCGCQEWTTPESLRKLRLNNVWLSKVFHVTTWVAKSLLTKFGTGRTNTLLPSSHNGVRWDFLWTTHVSVSRWTKDCQKPFARSLWRCTKRAWSTVVSTSSTGILRLVRLCQISKLSTKTTKGLSTTLSTHSLKKG